MNFQNFAAQNKGQIALQFFRSLFDNPDITLGELRDALCDNDIQPYLSTTLGAVLPHTNTKPNRKKREKGPSVADRVMAVLRSNPQEGFTVVELLKEVDVSEGYLRKTLEELTKDPETMVFMKERPNGIKGTNPYEYLWLGPVAE